MTELRTIEVAYEKELENLLQDLPDGMQNYLRFRLPRDRRITDPVVLARELNDNIVVAKNAVELFQETGSWSPQAGIIFR